MLRRLSTPARSPHSLKEVYRYPSLGDSSGPVGLDTGLLPRRRRPPALELPPSPLQSPNRARAYPVHRDGPICPKQLHLLRLPRIRTNSTEEPSSSRVSPTSPEIGRAINAEYKEARLSRRNLRVNTSKSEHLKTDHLKAFQLPPRSRSSVSFLGDQTPSAASLTPPTSTTHCSIFTSSPEANDQDARQSQVTDSPDVQRYTLSLPISKSWRRGTLLGQGSYGSVYKAQDCETGRIFAVKQSPLHHPDDEQKSLERLKAEIDIYRTLRHPNIVSCLGSGEVDGFLCLYLEYLPAGSMSSILREFGPLTEVQLLSASKGATEGIAYLHSRAPPIVHRDIKGANLLVSMDFKMKWADFGCSRHQVNTQTFTTIGSIPWIAPEVIVQQDGYGRKADIWSLGCTVLEMATAKNPWEELGFDNIVFALQHIGMTDSIPKISKAVPEEARAFIAFCLRRCPEERPSSQQLLEHDYLAGSNDTSFD